MRAKLEEWPTFTMLLIVVGIMKGYWMDVWSSPMLVSSVATVVDATADASEMGAALLPTIEAPTSTFHSSAHETMFLIAVPSPGRRSRLAQPSE